MDEVYGSLSFKDFVFREMIFYVLNSFYLVLKVGSDYFVRVYYYIYGFLIIIINCFNNYGLYYFFEKLIFLMCINILLGKELLVYGDG